MRMWLVPVKAMCNKHLLGEHVEIHMLAGNLALGRSINGYLGLGLLDPSQAVKRHKQLANEMVARGFNHKSSLDSCVFEDFEKNPHMDWFRNLVELTMRCSACKDKANQELDIEGRDMYDGHRQSIE